MIVNDRPGVEGLIAWIAHEYVCPVPWFDFTVFTDGVDLLSDQSLDAIDEHSSGYLADPPLEAAAFVRDGAAGKAMFSLEAADYDAAVAIAVAALKEALPEIEIISIIPGRHPGAVDLL
jgi:hypothetical protein